MVLFGFGAGPAGFDGGGDAAARTEIAFNHGPDGVAGLYDVFEHLIGDVLLKDSEIAIGEEIFLVGLEFETELAGHVAEGDDAEVGKAGLGADGGELGVIDQNFVTRELVFPGFDRGKRKVEPSFGVLVRVSFRKCHVFIVWQPRRRALPGVANPQIAASRWLAYFRDANMHLMSLIY